MWSRLVSCSPGRPQLLCSFYDPSRPGGVPWPSKDDAVLYRTVLPFDYKRVTEAFNISLARVRKSLMVDTFHPDFPVWVALFCFGGPVTGAEIAWCEETQSALGRFTPSNRPTGEKDRHS
jgi:hypothetical protein